MSRLGAPRLAIPAPRRPQVDAGPRDFSLPVDHAAVDQALDQLQLQREDLTRRELALHQTAVRARLVGATWQQLGDVLGMTAKSAWKRYVRPVTP